MRTMGDCTFLCPYSGWDNDGMGDYVTCCLANHHGGEDEHPAARPADCPITDEVFERESAHNRV